MRIILKKLNIWSSVHLSLFCPSQGSADPLNSAFHLTYNMVLNLLRVEEINPEYMLEKSFYQFQHYRAVPGVVESEWNNWPCVTLRTWCKENKTCFIRVALPWWFSKALLSAPGVWARDISSLGGNHVLLRNLNRNADDMSSWPLRGFSSALVRVCSYLGICVLSIWA